METYNYDQSAVSYREAGGEARGGQRCGGIHTPQLACTSMEQQPQPVPPSVSYQITTTTDAVQESRITPFYQQAQPLPAQTAQQPQQESPAQTSPAVRVPIQGGAANADSAQAVPTGTLSQGASMNTAAPQTPAAGVPSPASSANTAQASPADPADPSGTGASVPSAFSSFTDPNVSPGFGPLGPVTPSLPANSDGPGNSCVSCGPSGNLSNVLGSILWAWGVIPPSATPSAIAHVRFYNAAAIQEPLDIYLNGRLVVSELDYMNYTRYLHILPGSYLLTVYRRTNPGGAPIINNRIQLQSGNYYLLSILGGPYSYSVQLVTS